MLNSLFKTHWLALGLSVLVSACSTSPHLNHGDYSTHFTCTDKDKKGEYFFVNKFYFPPTPQEKENELPILKQRMEKELKMKLYDCKEVPDEYVPDDL
ncbi:hypothetical protein DXX93_18675 [Thalassotalea euphylliae]|uniref:Lipoprotein n=1 Tax=Thalassotalea euphylliae TaxID=1655234 RepID=A0A3E0TUX4_9GAMM|nr:hypothetical protein [Thalassotalea euphylliae]REL28388.1 hypothetical protein DXX93_18675 [Thalassotalea euphylliae]